MQELLFFEWLNSCVRRVVDLFCLCKFIVYIVCYSLYCILIAGLLLMCYVLLNQYFHGKVFLSLNFALDTIFEIVYCLFPLLYLSGDELFSLSSLGILGQQNGFIFIQSLLAMIILSRKCIFLMRDLNPIYITTSYWKQVRRKTKIDSDLTPWVVHKGKHATSYQGFDKSDLYRLIIAPLETKTVNMLQNNETNETNETIETQEIENDKLSSLAITNTKELNGMNTQLSYPQIQLVSASASVSVTPVATTPVSQNDDKTAFAFVTSDSITINDNDHDQKSPETQSLLLCTRYTCNYKLVDLCTIQQNGKWIIGGCGCALIVVGILISILFIGFIENDYKHKCFYNSNNNPNNSNSNWDEWFELHNELKYFETNCEYQVVNMFNDCPCNCRQYARYSYGNSATMDEFSPEMVELVFLNYNDLQSIYLHHDSPRISDPEFYFTIEMLSNVKYLQIWIMEDIGINHIWSSEGMSKLENLEIFVWRGTVSKSNTSIPFDAFAKLDKMKALSFAETHHVINHEIPDDICNLKQLRYFELDFVPNIEYVPFDCIATNWKELRVLEFQTFPQISYITPKFWKLPNLQTVILTENGFSVAEKSFDENTFDGFSESLTTVWLSSGVGVCNNGTTVIDNVEYQGFGYLDKTLSSSDDDSELREFIQTFEPCATPCSFLSFACVASEWQDGVCTDPCNRQDCGYDGGDCNQLCDCDYSLWFNDECDLSCNKTECNWDFYQCVQSTDTTNETCNIMMMSDDNIVVDSNYSVACYVSWIDDTWCDGSCNVEACGYDGGMCNSCDEQSQCGQILTTLNSIPGDDDDGDWNHYGNDLFTLGRACQYTDILASLVAEFDESDNCSYIFNAIDLNNNGFVGWYELLHTFSMRLGITTFSHWQEKVEQIDCSACLNNASYYYW